MSYIPMDGDGVNEVYLAADDGNVYFCAHMSQFVGGPRRVARGESGATSARPGYSTAPYLHFEIRVGGANGQRDRFYAMLQSAGCRFGSQPDEVCGDR